MNRLSLLLLVLLQVVPEMISEWRLYSSKSMLSGLRDVAGSIINNNASPSTDTSRQGDGAAWAAPRSDPDWRSCRLLVAEAQRPLIEALQVTGCCCLLGF